MTVTSIIRVPEVGEVGVKATFRASGEKVGTELRYYLAYAPVSSKLPTLATVTTDKRSDARLQVENGAAFFTPDVPGHYQVEVHDVTVVSTPRKYRDAPAVPDTDDDFGAAPVVNLSTVEAFSRYEYGEFMVAQSVTRVIGSAPNTLTVSLRIHDSIELRFPDAVTFTPSASKIAQIAAYDDQVLGCRDLLLDGNVRGNRSIGFLVWSGILQDFISEVLRTDWNDHLVADASWEVHNSADAANEVLEDVAVDLASALSQLITLRIVYEDHASSGVFHDAADTINKFAAGTSDPTDLATGIAFARKLFRIMVHGQFAATDYLANGVGGGADAISGHFIAIGPHKAPFDPLGNYTFDFSSSVEGLCRATNELSRVFNLHLARTTLAAPHVSADTNNALLTSVTDNMSTAEIVAWVNAFADSIERHTADVYLDATTGQLVSSVHHQNTRPIKIGKRAGNMKSAIELLELCCIAYERHALDGGPTVTPAEASPAHATAVLGSRFRQGPWPLMTRLQGHWQRATSAALLEPPSHFNGGPPSLLGIGWELRRHGLAAVLVDLLARSLVDAADRVSRVGEVPTEAIAPLAGQVRGLLRGHRHTRLRRRALAGDRLPRRRRVGGLRGVAGQDAVLGLGLRR